MRFTVVWGPEAEQQLAEEWLNAPDRDAVTQAARRIEQVLQSRPEEVGESRSPGIRVYLSEPLGVNYTVSPDDRIVRVIDVWSFETRRK